MDVLALPFDQYQRYRLVVDLVGRVRGDRERLAVLDVGGRTALLRAFLPDDDVTLVDVEPSDEPGLILGTGARLPFRDDAFDVVAAFDTLEHVPPEGRDAFVDECARVCRGHVMIAGPCKSPEVDEAEELLQQYLATKLDLVHRYLQEHRDHGLPVRDDVEQRLARAGASVRTFGHGNLDRWLVLMCMEMYMDHDPGLRPLATRFFRFYNESLYASDHAPPVYRQVIVGAFGGSPLPDPEGLLDVARAPAEALARVTDFALELVAFDREKDVWKPEFARLEGIIGDLEEDLAGHRSRLADTQQDLDEHARNLADLRRDYDNALTEHAAERATLAADLAEHERTVADQQARFEESEREHAAERATLERDLAEHKASLAQKARDFDELEAEHRRSVDEHRGVISTLEGELAKLDAHRQDLERLLAETQAAAQSIQGDLVDAQQGLATLNAELAARDETIAGQRARLRNRVDSLKRAFGPKKDA